MKKQIKLKVRLIISIILLTILLTPFYILDFLPDNSNFASNSEETGEDDGVNTDINPIESPEISITGGDPWWNLTYQYRRLINVTNTYSVNLENYGVSVSFNYKTLVQDGKLNESLKDLRIVENGNLKKYYFKKDYPEQDYVTVWFDTDVAANSEETDTYLYYGNMDAEIDDQGNYFMNESSNSPSDSFGWIRNGNFELDNKTGKNINNLFGWTWTDDVLDDLYPGQEAHNYSTQSYNLYQNNLSTYDVGMEVTTDNFSFKWGDTRHTLPHDAHTSGSHDYAGTLFSYPFTVPEVSGGTDPRIHLEVDRNIRMWDHDNSNSFGYFMCISSGTSYDQNEVDNHNPYGSGYIEDYSSLGRFFFFFWLYESSAGNNLGSGNVDTYEGGLTGTVSFDLTDWEGQTIFFEVGMYGAETSGMTSFGQIDELKFEYDDIEAVLNEEEEQKSDITVITRDVDGRIVPEADVWLNNTWTLSTSENDASAIFTGMELGDYNITVNYTLRPGLEKVMYSSSEFYIVDEAAEIFNIELNMTTIDFEIVDLGGRPLKYGFVNLKESESSNSLVNLSLDDNGKTTFRWRNRPSYYFEVHYNDLDYNLNPYLLNASYVYRSNYDTWGKKFRNHNIFVKGNDIDSRLNYYTLNKSIYTDGSKTQIGNKKITQANITLSGMTDYLTEVSIYYIDKNNSTEGNLLYYNNTYTDTDQSDVIKIDIRLPPEDCANLFDDYYEVYGLFISVNGQNSSGVCNGLVDIDLTETWNVFNQTTLARLNVGVRASETGEPIGGVKVIIESEIKGELLAINLTTFYNISDENDPKNGYALTPKGLDFLYLSGYKYNISLKFHTYDEFEVLDTDPSQWMPVGYVLEYNYTLEQDNSTVKLELNMEGVNPDNFRTELEDLTFPNSVTWSENVTVEVYCNSTTDNWASWDPLSYPDVVLTCTVESTGAGSKVWLTLEMNPGALPGWFILEFNSSLLSAGNFGKTYVISITGVAGEYIDPGKESDTIYINTVTTAITLHNYNPPHQIIAEVSKYYGQIVNITVRYVDNNSVSLAPNAVLTYDWLNLGPTQFYEDPINKGYYTFTLDTSISQSTGKKSIKIEAELENYTAQINVLIVLDILDRPTKINGDPDLYYDSWKVWVEDTEYLDFEYTDTLGGGGIIGDLDTYSFSWQEVDEEGDPEGPEGSGVLTENSDHSYRLNFKTGSKDVGYYLIFITLKKDNYEARAAYINLEIEERILDYDIDATNYKDDQITVVKGEDIVITVELIDTTRGDIPLTEATVTLTIGEDEYEFEEIDDGVYELVFETDDVEAFFTSQTFTGEITIKKENFETEEEDITLVIKMEEIMPGVPTFYFILISTAIIGTIGSLIGYRVIQQARIPKFVKKARNIKNAIKSRKSIPDSISIPSKEKLIKKLIGAECEKYGLSLEHMLEIEGKKGKSLTDIKESFKSEGGDF